MTVTFITFSFTTVVQFANLKSLIFSTSLIFLNKMEKYVYLKNLHETDTSLYFITAEKVAVSLPTKCLCNPTSA